MVLDFKMAFSLFNKNLGDEIFFVNDFNFKAFGDEYLISSVHGAWTFLSKDEFNSFRKGDFSSGDFVFERLKSLGFIVTQSNFQSINNAYACKINSLLTTTPLNIIVLTLRCNQKCVYCHSAVRGMNEKNYDMSFDTCKSVVDFIFQNPSDQIVIEFQGGEPLLRKDLVKFIVEYSLEKNKILKKKLSFYLVSNLVLLDKEFANFLNEYNISVCSSLDGPKELHNKQRCSFSSDFDFSSENLLLEISELKDNHACVIKNLNFLKDEFDTVVPVLMVTTRNTFPYYRDLIDEFVKLGQTSIQLKYLSHLGFASDNYNSIGYSVEEFLDYFEKALDYILDLNLQGIFLSERYLLLILKRIYYSGGYDFLDFRNPCGMVLGQMAFNYNGDIYPCDEARNFEELKLGNVTDVSYKNVVFSEKALNLLDYSFLENYDCNSCVYQPYCGVCPVLSYAEQKNFLKTKSRCKINKFMFDYIFLKLKDEKYRNIFENWLKKIR